MSPQTRGPANALDDQAYILMQSAVSLISQGQWAKAAVALEQAADIHAQAGRAYDQARCLQLAATLRRSTAQPDQASSLLKKAAAVAPDDQPLAIAILTEQAETAFAEHRYEEAIGAYTGALDTARQAGLKAEGLSTLLRRRAAAFIALGNIQRAAADFDEAFQLLDATSGPEVASFVRIEQAGLLWQYGHYGELEHVIAALETSLEGQEVSLHVLAEVLVARARLSRNAGLLDTAAIYADRARDAALQAVAPVSYFAASVELAEALQARGDYTDAYGTLATAWATLSDVLGQDTAGSWVEPVLLGYTLKWGESAFRQAKSDYEQRRRREIQQNR
jgi:tetratricopeptide (TPR) repeat protein